MPNLQRIGPIGSEIDLQNTAGIMAGFTQGGSAPGPKPVRNEILEMLPNGGVVLPRSDTPYYTLELPIVILGAGHQTRLTLLRSLEAMLEEAAQFHTTLGIEGTAAFYTEQYGDQTAAD
jgi:hypothetical protein